MSLINEALKKAQKLRTGDPTEQAPMPGGGARITKRGEARSTQQLVMIAAGAVVLIVLSVVATFWFLNRAPEPPAESKPVASVKPSDASAANPTIPAPATKPPAGAETPAAEKPAPIAPVDPAVKPASTVATATQTASTPQPANPAPENPTPPKTAAIDTPATPTPSTPAPEPIRPTLSNVPTDPRVHAYVDTLKVMGIRSSGGDSRVLMNDRVFRVNDIVERTLGVRLTGVAADALTFTDSNGAVYVKNF